MTLLRINELELVGGNRTIEFRRSLSVVRGDIATGKTTLLRLMRGFLGAMPSSLPPEARRVTHLRGSVTIGAETWDILRPRTSTRTAKVDIAGPQIYRLPAQTLDETADLTYQDWMLERLGIHKVVVPVNRSQPERGDTVPVTINDWLRWCIVPGPEIDSMVFGHRERGVEEKRRWVFDLNYGYYDPEAAAIQAELRQVEQRLVGLVASDASIREFLKGSALEDVQALRARYEQVQRALRDLGEQEAELAQDITRESGVAVLRQEALEAQNSVAEAGQERSQLRHHIADLEDLRGQLVAQARRLTRAIVAEERLLAVEFVVCPRCGQDVQHRDVPEDDCVLCLQSTAPGPDTRTVLINEQDRIQAQILETSDVLEARRSELEMADDRVRWVTAEAKTLTDLVDRRTNAYAGREAERIRRVADRRATLESELQRLTEYLAITAAREKMADQAAQAQREKAALLDELDQRDLGQADADERVRRVERRMLEYLQFLEVPEVGDLFRVELPAPRRLPTIGGRTFESLSSQGLSVLVNIAHALAHHTVSIDLGLQLPGLLVLDGISSNAGREDWDARREDNAFRLIAEVAKEYENSMQTIVIDNNVPSWLVDERAVVAELGARRRLIL